MLREAGSRGWKGRRRKERLPFPLEKCNRSSEPGVEAVLLACQVHGIDNMSSKHPGTQAKAVGGTEWDSHSLTEGNLVPSPTKQAKGVNNVLSSTGLQNTKGVEEGLHLLCQ